MPPEPPIPLPYAQSDTPISVSVASRIATAIAALLFSGMFLELFALVSGMASHGPANSWLGVLEGILLLLAFLLIAFLLYKIEIRRLRKRAMKRHASFRLTRTLRLGIASNSAMIESTCN
jgi:uncharacterized membrane protein YqhA